MGSPRIAKSLPLQVAAVCYRRRGAAVEFLLVNTNGGKQVDLPQGIAGSPPLAQPGRRARSSGRSRCAGHHRAAPLSSLYSLQGRVLAAGRRAGVCGESLSDGSPRGAPADEPQRQPTWFSAEEARQRLAKGREVKYAHELEAVIDRALERIHFHSELWGKYPESRNGRAAAHSLHQTCHPEEAESFA